MSNLLKILLIVVQIPIASYAVNKTPHLIFNKLKNASLKATNTVTIEQDGSPLGYESTEDYRGPHSKIVTSTIVDIKLNKITSNKEVIESNSNNLTIGEATAAGFALLKFPPTFEQATIDIPIVLTILLTSPNAYLGKMSPLRGKAHWLQGDDHFLFETIDAPNGYALLRWPANKLGTPKNAKLILQMDSPVIAVQYLWSDFTCYGNDTTQFLLHQVTNWNYSSRYLAINRSGYREILFPTNIKDGVRHNQVGPILEPYLKQAVPQLFEELKSEGMS